MTNPALDHSSPTVRTPLRRSSTERMLGGVCGGLAEYSGLDPVLWRVGMVALTLLGPGVVVYLLLWVLMPKGPDHTPGPLDPAIDRLHSALDGALSGMARR
jgi:phage shock protein PspC (stress-responsive transcriptional regulator)